MQKVKNRFEKSTLDCAWTGAVPKTGGWSIDRSASFNRLPEPGPGRPVPVQLRRPGRRQVRRIQPVSEP